MTLARLLVWDFMMLVRYHVITATILSLALLCGFILLTPRDYVTPSLAALFVFSDPALIGLSFVGAVVLMEKAANTIAAISVTPLPPSVYVASKILSMSIVGLIAGLAVAATALRGDLDWALYSGALALSNVAAVLIGFIAVARVRSMNEFMIRLLFITLFLWLPLLENFNVLTGPAAWPLLLIPSQAILFLLRGAADPTSIAAWQWVYGVTYLSATTVVCWVWAIREFNAAVASGGR